ncbi:hypothetical protein GGI12_004359 [Dipsacomyces acuminosporus]|nr:hypothetical protein GGI12_004359 [Dipsacomyces acuminosporus]
MSTLPIRVVIVGISWAGIRAAKTIAALSKKGFPNLQVTLVNSRDYFYDIVGAPRAIAERDFCQKLLFPLEGLLRAYEIDPRSPRHRFVKASLLAVNSNETVTLSNGEVIAFDYLVLATGTSGPHPSSLKSLDFDKAVREMSSVNEAVERAQKILIVGGGAVGVETAGEISARYPEKRVTLVHRGRTLLPDNIKTTVGEGAAAKLRKSGVKLVLNEQIMIPDDVEFSNKVRPLGMKSSEGTWYDSDLQILATGSVPQTGYMASLESQTAIKLRDSEGWIRVKPTLQLDCKWFPHIFVAGDANNFPYSAKYAIKAEQQGAIAGENVAKLIYADFSYAAYGRKHKPAELKEWKDHYTHMLVPLGKEMGVAQIFGIGLGNSIISNAVVRHTKGRDYFQWKRDREFK